MVASFLQGLKPLLFSFTAGLKACSTLWGKDFPGLKPQIQKPLYAALKGRSSTATGVC